MANRHLFTSESVTEGHPDKVSDQISDAVLDAVMTDDPMGRVACETLVTTGLVVVAGEMSTGCYVDVRAIVRGTIRSIGYTEPQYGFDYASCGVMLSIQEQSADIQMGVDPGGAGDQGMMFGFATTETPELMPMPIMLAHRLTRRLAEIRKEGVVDFLGPDGKSQVTIEYDNGRPVRIDTVVIAAHHSTGVDEEHVRRDIRKHVIKPCLPEGLADEKTKILINPTGRFEIGGPQADTGLTGRKIISDTYGGVGSHGGGCFSGKDPTKVDRSASYMARYVAKNIVAAGLAEKCEIQLAYAIGVAEPVSLMVNCYGTGKVEDDRLVEIVRDVFDLTPKGIIEKLQLRRPIYRQTACYGHFGRDEEGFTWEKTDRADDLQSSAG